MDFSPLPVLRSKVKHEIPPAVILQLNFLWEAIYSVAQTSLQLSFSYSRKFLDLVDQHGVDLPKSHACSSKLCENCGVIQLPSVTTTNRVHSISLKNRINRKRNSTGSMVVSASLSANANTNAHANASGSDGVDNSNNDNGKLKNVLVVKCLWCDHSYHDSSSGNGNGNGNGNGLIGITRDKKVKKTKVEAKVTASPSPVAKKKQPFSFSSRQSNSNSVVGIGSSNNSPSINIGISFSSSSSFRSSGEANSNISNNSSKLSLDEIARQNKKAKKEAKKQTTSLTSRRENGRGGVNNNAPTNTLLGLGGLLKF